jgi:hypothetical protein
MYFLTISPDASSLSQAFVIMPEHYLLLRSYTCAYILTVFKRINKFMHLRSLTWHGILFDLIYGNYSSKSRPFCCQGSLNYVTYVPQLLKLLFLPLDSVK